ncbi:MAG: glutathione S-transferase N-terminal domain-containing protein, partial [Oceanococcaceae bacterium]
MHALPILYSFRRCPYAMRARLALAVAGIPVELREVLLRDKPAELLHISPKATVPVLHLADGQVLEHSLDIMLWALEQKDPEGWLQADRALSLDRIEENDGPFKHWLDRYKYWERHPEHSKEYYRGEAEAYLQSWEQALHSQGALLAEHWTLADWALLPFWRQFAHSDRGWWATAP